MIVEINNIGVSQWSVTTIHPECPDGSLIRFPFRDIPTVISHCKDIRVNLTDDEIDHLKKHGFLKKMM